MLPGTLRSACVAHVRACAAGFLKACPLGGCGCESGPRYCQRGLDIWTTDRDNDGCNNVDLYLRAGAPPPSEWVDAIAAAELLYASPEPPACYMPEVGRLLSCARRDAVSERRLHQERQRIPARAGGQRVRRDRRVVG